MRTKIVRVLVLIGLSSIMGTSHAGFVTGVVVGSAVSGSTTVNESPLHVASDTHDVIACQKVLHQQMCRVPWYVKDGINMDKATPEQYATMSGYHTVHRVSIGVVPGRSDYIFMEVSK